MPRLAGDSKHYKFVLKDYNGRYHQDITIELVSVTSVLSAVLAKPMLPRWAYNQTRDAISGLASLYSEQMGEGYWDEFTEMLTDADMLEEYLKENKLRPEDTTDLAAERGHKNHAFMERLGTIALKADDETATLTAKMVLAHPEKHDGWARGIAQWWVDVEPEIVASEAFVRSLVHGYCGTVDVVYKDHRLPGAPVTICDLKTRGAGKDIYESDHIQVGGYFEAWNEHRRPLATRRTVLLVREDGSVTEEESTIDPRAFLKLLEVYKMIREEV